FRERRLDRLPYLVAKFSQPRRQRLLLAWSADQVLIQLDVLVDGCGWTEGDPERLTGFEENQSTVIRLRLAFALVMVVAKHFQQGGILGHGSLDRFDLGRESAPRAAQSSYTSGKRTLERLDLFGRGFEIVGFERPGTGDGHFLKEDRAELAQPLLR